MLSARLERGAVGYVQQTLRLSRNIFVANLWVSYDTFLYGALSIFMEIAIVLNSLFLPPHKDYGLWSSSTSSNFTGRMNVLSKDLICGLVEYINLSPEIWRFAVFLMSGSGVTGRLIWMFFWMVFLVVKRFRVCHGLQGKDPSDDQYGINHCFGGDFWGYSSNEYTIAGNTSRHITHPSDFVCWFIPSMGHLVRRFTALLTTWLLKVSWQPIKAHSNELCLITCWTCWQHPG